MSDNDSVDRLNQISSLVNERDKTVWENAAYSAAIRRKIEMFQNKISSIEEEAAEKEKQISYLENYNLILFNNTEGQKHILQTSEQSAIMQKSLWESVQQEAKFFKQKYAGTQEKYNDMVQEYISIYENASQGHQDFKANQISLKKLEIEKMELDAKIEDSTIAQKRCIQIQKQITQKNIVDYAEFYFLSHKIIKLSLLVNEKKKRETVLLKEHLQLSEVLKERKRLGLKSKFVTGMGNKPIPELVKENALSSDKLKKFLDEEFLPCNLTRISSSQHQMVNFNNNYSKVKILDMKIVKPSMFKSPEQLNIDLRKKMQNVIELAKKEALRSPMMSFCSQKNRTVSNSDLTPSGSPSLQCQTENNSQKSNESSSQIASKLESSQVKNVAEASSQVKNIAKPSSQVKNIAAEASNQVKNTAKPSSQVKNIAEASSEVKNIAAEASSQVKNIAKPSSQVKNIEKPLTPRETVTTSILKPSSQDITKKENVSNFFNSKKKTVTFQKEIRPQIPNFQLFAEEKTTEPAKVENVFNSSFFFNREDQPILESDILRSDSTHNTSFTMETGPTFGTSMGENTGKSAENISFDLMDVSMNRGFVPNPNPAPDTTPFSFFGSQAKSINPFNFF